MSNDFLSKIVAHKKSLLKEKKDFFAALKDKIKESQFNRYHLFKKAISCPGQVNLIAEIKKASPSRGMIRPNFDVMPLAKTYVESGACAISVLTEEKYFLGKPPYVRTVSENFTVPVLTKDFIIDEVQIFETFCLGSSAVLLIAAILDDQQLAHLIKTANNLDLDCLVEVHDEPELERVLKTQAPIIGINNRNLHTFEVVMNTTRQLVPKIPKDRIVVVESGIKCHEDIKMIEELGAHAVLIGETFLRAFDTNAKIKEVMHGQS